MSQRQPFAYVVSIDGHEVTLNMRDEHRGQLVGHSAGVSAIAESGALVGVVSGPELLVLRVRALRFAEAEAAHKWKRSLRETEPEPLRHLVGSVLGYLVRSRGKVHFEADALRSPPLGAEAVPLTHDELQAVRAPVGDSGATITIGRDVRSGADVSVDLGAALGRHVAVLGSTGQGKSCLTAAVLQQIMRMPHPRVVVFDVNGEYDDALRGHARGATDYRRTVLGGGTPTRKLPYYAFGRHGLGRILLPSERTQRPALNFALESLKRVEWVPRVGAKLVDGDSATLFDDCRPAGAEEALEAVEALRRRTAREAAVWPHMMALSALVAESHATRRGTRGPERNAFEYSNVAPLVTRIRRCVEDPMFCAVVDVQGGAPVGGAGLSWKREGSALVEDIFGAEESGWKVHVVDVRGVAHDLLPLVLGGLLELLAFELFERGPGRTHPTLVVLEEAHHYLRRLNEADGEGGSTLAYERLAKEGRKFGVALWLSTQRPSEVSPTVLSQCGTWAVFRLAGDADLRAVAGAGEWVDDRERQRIAGLPRQQAVVFGAGVRMPIRVRAPLADPVPRSHDPGFHRWAE